MTDFESKQQREQARQAASLQRRTDWESRFARVMADQDARIVLHEFMRQCGLDGSAFNTNAMAQSHAIGRQDAARWWINEIRRICPEVEAKVRSDGQQWQNVMAQAKAIGEQGNAY